MKAISESYGGRVTVVVGLLVSEPSTRIAIRRRNSRRGYCVLSLGAPLRRGKLSEWIRQPHRPAPAWSSRPCELAPRPFAIVVRSLTSVRTASLCLRGEAICLSGADRLVKRGDPDFRTYTQRIPKAAERRREESLHRITLCLREPVLKFALAPCGSEGGAAAAAVRPESTSWPNLVPNKTGVRTMCVAIGGTSRVSWLGCPAGVPGRILAARRPFCQTSRLGLNSYPA